MTDSQPPKKTPARRTPAKPAEAKTPTTRSTTAKTTAAKAPAAKAPAAKTPTAKAPAAKSTAATTTAAKTTAAKAPAAKPAASRTRAAKPATDAATTAPAAAFAPVEPTVATAVAPAAATAPAGWYPVSAGSSTQRYWDGQAWTEHVHDPAAAAAATAAATPAPHAHLRAPEGTSANTLWMWLTVGSMAISIVYWIVTAVYWSSLVNVNLDYEAATANQWADPLYIVSFVLGLVSTVALIVFPILDWAQLRKRGVPKPFHWAWSLFALPLGSPIVYVIGRSVVAKRRTGGGLAPLWVFIALQIIAWIVALIAIVTIIVGIFTGFLSIFNDAGEIL